MGENIFTKVFGEMHQMKVLGFFLEHPLHSYTVIKIAKYYDLSRDTVKNDIKELEAFGYVKRMASRGPFKIDLNNPYVQEFIDCSMRLNRIQLQIERGIPVSETKDELYVKQAKPSLLKWIAGA